MKEETENGGDEGGGKETNKREWGKHRARTLSLSHSLSLSGKKSTNK